MCQSSVKGNTVTEEELSGAVRKQEIDEKGCWLTANEFLLSIRIPIMVDFPAFLYISSFIIIY